MINNLPLLNIFFNASLLVKLVMLTLLLASIVSWAFIFQRARTLKLLKNKVADFENIFASGIELKILYSKLLPREKQLFGLEAIFLAAYKEFVNLQQQKITEPTIILDNLQRVMQIGLVREQQRLENQLSFLATVQSISPYIGLFGTVWGIMIAMRELGSTMGQVTISMVAPGISEALIATAMGLVAAIPAGIAYNRFTNKANLLGDKYQMFSEKLAVTIQRDLWQNQQQKPNQQSTSEQAAQQVINNA